MRSNLVQIEHSLVMLAQLGSYSTEPNFSSLSTMSFAAFYKTQEFYDFCVTIRKQSPYHQTGDTSLVNAAVAALDTVSGPTWQKQFREERRVDPADGKARILAALYRTYHEDYTHQEIVEYLAIMKVVEPLTAGKGIGKSRQLAGQLTAPPTATATSTATTLETYQTVQPKSSSEAAAAQSGFPGAAPHQLGLQTQQEPQELSSTNWRDWRATFGAQVGPTGWMDRFHIAYGDQAV